MIAYSPRMLGVLSAVEIAAMSLGISFMRLTNVGQQISAAMVQSSEVCMQVSRVGQLVSVLVKPD